MNTFKLKFGSDAAKTLAEHNVTGATLTLNANAPDELAFDVDAAFDAAGHAYGTEVRLYEAAGGSDVCRFVGEILELPAETDALAGPSRRYVARSYLARLARIQYTQTVRAYDGAATPALATFADACVVLGRHGRSPFEAASTGRQIADVLDYAMGTGAFPCSRDADAGWDMGFGIPCDQRENVTCWEAILCMLRWMPDRVLWCDYSTGSTVVRLKAASALPAAAVAASGGTLASVRATPRHDLALPGVNVYFRRVDSVDGRNRERRYVQRAGTHASPFAANLYIDLEGGSTTHVSQEITTLAYPTMGDNAGFRSWLELKIPWLADATSYTVDDVRRSGAHAYPRELVGGVFKKWMRAAREEETIEVTVSYLVEDANSDLVDRATVVLPIAVTSTGAASGTYRTTASYDSGETPPAGLADGIYASWGRLHWDGSLETDLDAAGGWGALPVPGALINVTGGPSALASMDAVVQSCRVDLANGSAEATFGTCRALEADSLCALYRALRGRRHSWKRNLDEADSGGASDEGGSGTDGLPQRSGGTGSPAIARSGLALGGPASTASGAPTHSFSMKPEDVDFQASGETAAAQAVRAREVRVIVDDNGTLKAKWAQVLCGEPYGAAQPVGGGGGVPTAAETNTTLPSSDAGAEGGDTANSTTWTANGTTGLVEWYVSRVVYVHTASTPVLYAFLRKRTVSADGRIVSVTGETRVGIDTPVSVSIS